MRTPSYLVPPPPSPFRTQPHYSLCVRTLQPSELITHSQGWFKPYRGTPGTSLEMSKHSVQQFSGRMRSGKLRPLLVCRVCRRHQHYCVGLLQLATTELQPALSAQTRNCATRGWLSTCQAIGLKVWALRFFTCAAL